MIKRQTSYFGKIPKCITCKKSKWFETYDCECGEKKYFYEEDQN